MKNLFLIATAFFAFVFGSCVSQAKTETHGKESIAYLQIFSDEFNEVDVSVDGITFRAKTNKKNLRSNSAKNTYKIAPGAHDILILASGNQVLQKKIFASNGEIKTLEVQ